MKVLITGVAGFVGSTLAHRLLSMGQEVVGIDSVNDYYSRDLKYLNIRGLCSQYGFTFHEENLASSPLSERLKDVEVVFHQAGQPGVRKSWGQNFSHYLDWNVLGTQKLLEACKSEEQLTRMVYASSSSVYGNATHYPTREQDLPQPISPYGVSKLAAEHLVTLYAKNYGLPTVSLRYFTVFGPRQRPDMAFTRFVTAAQTNDTITVFGNGDQVRDFTYVDDVVEANLAAAFTASTPSGSVYNVSGGSSVSVNEILETVEEIHGCPLNIQYVSQSLGDAVRTGGDSTKIRSDLGWSPRVTVRDGLERQYLWARENLQLLAPVIAE
ncbi:NAD-dependent epimerase/dehydratase family protein [Kocuria rhizosphaericola]|uniref:NAD-dependent epimerase/dehydratase family protein n=1 Tax=Kocuria rhizosphaericola TaxID=3376284 RepID=UPI0037AD25AC